MENNNYIEYYYKEEPFIQEGNLFFHLICDKEDTSSICKHSKTNPNYKTDDKNGYQILSNILSHGIKIGYERIHWSTVLLSDIELPEEIKYIESIFLKKQMVVVSNIYEELEELIG